MGAKLDVACPEAEHYADCPKFRKTCDAINCWAKYTWKERAAWEKARKEKA